MGRRSRLLSESIVKAIIKTDQPAKKGALKRILSFFNVFQISLEKYDPDLFYRLRHEAWLIDENNYIESFKPENHDHRESLVSVGDLGYSGSAFFATTDSNYLIKSIPRRSEYDFFEKDLLGNYYDYIMENPNSLLVRITDYTCALSTTIGIVIGATPPHNIVMENILFGKDQDEKKEKWETYDLKPVSYFYPERDLAGGHLASDSVKERLIDTFDDKIRVSRESGQELLDQLASDCKLLMDCNVVDYSLFIVRYPIENKVPQLESRTSVWRSGVKSTDGKWVYRAIMLDYFWAKHKLHAQTMTGLIKTFNFFSGKGHMSITTSAEEYRKRFLGMVETLFERPQDSNEHGINNG